jgi:hypothetical protein
VLLQLSQAHDRVMKKAIDYAQQDVFDPNTKKLLYEIKTSSESPFPSMHITPDMK